MEDIIINLFTIGEEFALNEFDLEYIKTKTDINGIDYDYYRFTKGIKETYIKEIILVYNCDILRGVFCFS